MTESVHTPPVAGRRPPRGLFDLPPTRRRRAGRTKAQTQDSRAHNRSLLLATLYRDGAMSRADLSRVSSLTAPTVSALVADLEADGLVADVVPRQEGGRRRGKPSMLVEIQDDAVNLVVLDLSHGDYFRGAVTNLRGEIVERSQVAIGGALGDAAYDHVIQLVADLLQRAPRRVLGIGVGSPGIVDDTGTVRQAAHLEWHDLAMARRLTERFGVPAYVANDVNTAALAVLHFRGTEAQNLMVIANEHGVGAGLVVGGELVEGEQFAAGEIGHLTVDVDGEPCVCGRRGCLDPMIDAGHLRGRLAAAAGGERDAILAAAGQALGTVLAPIACALNLNEIVLTGPADLIDGPLLDAAVETVQTRTLAPIGASLTIRSLAGDDDLVLLGGACQVLAAQLGIL
ncbi:ROK family transcriptional regulator [Kitasatospora sp. NBC_00240]|uniref:ROK family transcriptional regulator n=1 Tax=Kitasatospora sp. NBC_00240 TaxID=2903567 RepID=UPI002256B0F3|nr:ROK family transcriptional regulator [Kitasatospora sp. NBC_00240]MCX5216034.1 ROK family transcriptional regulator [Kitasatospora sp. NBC_00240]